MKKCWLIFMFAISPTLFATDLMDVYHEALNNDTQFKIAYSTYMANSEAVPQALAALLPQVNLSAQVANNLMNVDASIFSTDTTYSSKQWQLNGSQAIFNYRAWKMVQQAKASVKAAQATFNNAAQDLMLRTANAYLDVLLAQDTLNFQEAKKRANKRQFEQANERFKVGLDAITSVYEAKSAYNQSTADVIASKNNQVNRNEGLRKLTNHVYEYLAPLRNAQIPLAYPEPNRVDEWVNTGLKQNYNLLASKFNLEAARENIKAQSAGNWPVIALQGNAQQVINAIGPSQEGLDSVFIPNNQQTKTIALNVSAPVLQGGLVLSKTRQAQYNYQVSSEQLEQLYRDVIVNSRTTFNSVIDGISKIEADKQTVISRVNQLNSTAAQFDAGTRTMVDVVNAQQRLFEAQVQLATDQYQLIKTQLQLKYLAGTLNANDLEEINSWLDTVRINRFPRHV